MESSLDSVDGVTRKVVKSNTCADNKPERKNIPIKVPVALSWEIFAVTYISPVIISSLL